MGGFVLPEIQPVSRAEASELQTCFRRLYPLVDARRKYNNLFPKVLPSKHLPYFKHALEGAADDVSEDQGNEIIHHIAHFSSIQNPGNSS